MAGRFHLRAQTVLAVLLILGFILVAALAEEIAPTTGELVDGVQLAGRSNDKVPHPPSPDILLGTTPGQMDIFYALIHGTHDALIFGLLATLLTTLIGLIVGTTGGMGGKWINQLSMRFTDGVLCFPVIAGIAFFQQVINMTLLSLTGEKAIFYYPTYMAGIYKSYLASLRSQEAFSALMLVADPVLIGLVVLSWVPYARMMNILILQTKKMEYVTAARAEGAKGVRIFLRHILPNTAPNLIVLATKDIGQMVVWQTTFAFVGFESLSAWAAPLLVSRSWILGINGNPLEYWWVYLPITLAIILFAFAWNLLGDEINHYLNPKN